MSRITAIKPVDKLKRWQKVYLDGRFAFSMAAGVVKEAGLGVGQEVDSERVAALAGHDRQCRLMQHARRYLSYRPQSEAELKKKLARRGAPQSEVETTCARLKVEGLLDDGDFARFWKENRQSFAPRSQRLVCQELRRKGVPEDVIESVVGDINDSESAYCAALAQARRLALGDYQLFCQRLGGYLKRRGFDDEVIQKTLSRIWQEMGDISVHRRLSYGYPHHKGILIKEVNND